MFLKTGYIFLLALLILSHKNLPENYMVKASWNIQELNTAIDAHYLTSYEKEIILEINKLRNDPAKYASDYIEPLKSQYQGKLLYYPGDLPLKTREGIRALEECIRELKNTDSLPILSPSPGLSKAAADHVADQSINGGIGHKGKDKSGYRERIERYGIWSRRIAENIAYGNVSPQQIVIYLLIDDGIPSRGHRKNFLNKEMNLIGIATGYHPSYKKMCVMDFAGIFQTTLTEYNYSVP